MASQKTIAGAGAAGLAAVGAAVVALSQPPMPAPSVEAAAPEGVPGSFYSAKKAMYAIWAEQPQTFYCGCAFDPEAKTVELDSCGMESMAASARARRTEAEHIVPASRFAAHLPCWEEGGRKACEKTPAFNDLYNLAPVVGQINNLRSDFSFSVIEGEERVFGACDFEIDQVADIAEPPVTVMGDIARTWLYMESTYGFHLSRDERALYRTWSAADPVDAWEHRRAQHIAEIQGEPNPFIGPVPDD